MARPYFRVFHRPMGRDRWEILVQRGTRRTRRMRRALLSGGRRKRKTKKRRTACLFWACEEKQTITGEYISFELVIQWTSLEMLSEYLSPSADSAHESLDQIQDPLPYIVQLITPPPPPLSPFLPQKPSHVLVNLSVGSSPANRVITVRQN